MKLMAWKLSRRAAVAWRASLSSALIATALPCTVSADEAADYPNKPVRLVLPFAAGGVSDVIFRALANELSQQLGQPFVVEIRAGGGGTVGAGYAAGAAPDGYTLLQSNPTMIAVAPRLVKGLSYDPERSFTPIATVVTTPNIMLANKNVPVKTLQDLPAFVKKGGQGKVSFATAGIGSTGHTSGHILQQALGIEMGHIPYKGAGQAVPDLLAGRVAFLFDSVPSAIGHIRASSMAPVVVFSRTRSSVLPDVQTVAEAGYPQATLDFWMGLEGPANMPKPIVDKLNQAVKRALESPAMKQQLASVGADPFHSSPDEFAQLRSRDIRRLGEVVETMKLTD